MFSIRKYLVFKACEHTSRDLARGVPTPRLFSLIFLCHAGFKRRVNGPQSQDSFSFLLGLFQRAERPRRVRAEAPCGDFRTVVNPIPYWLTTVQSVDLLIYKVPVTCRNFIGAARGYYATTSQRAAIFCEISHCKITVKPL